MLSVSQQSSCILRGESIKHSHVLYHTVHESIYLILHTVCMDDEADDVLKGLNLSAACQRQYDAVKNVVSKNVLYERTCFNMRKQEVN